MRVLLTGATGFAGGAILRSLLAAGMHVRAPVRKALPAAPRLEVVLIDDLLTADWQTLCADIDIVIHAAAYAHDDRADPHMIFRVNRDATANLAKAASACGARFIFLSSIRAQAGVTAPIPLRDGDRPQPDGPYGEAKLAAEAAIRDACANHVVLRLAPLYGHGVKGNLASLFHVARRGVPLPFGAVHAQRSLLRVETLATLTVRLVHDHDVQGTFLTAEPGALSIGEMIAALRTAWGQSARLVPIPASMLRSLCLALRRPMLWARIGEPLIVADDQALQRHYPDVFKPSSEGLTLWAHQAD